MLPSPEVRRENARRGGAARVRRVTCGRCPFAVPIWRFAGEARRSWQDLMRRHARRDHGVVLAWNESPLLLLGPEVGSAAWREQDRRDELAEMSWAATASWVGIDCGDDDVRIAPRRAARVVVRRAA